MEEKKPTFTAIIVALNGSKVLMHQRKKIPFYNYWGFPGGKIQFGENPEETAGREFFEETGLKGEMEFKGIIMMKTYDNGELAHHHYHHIFICKNTSGNLMDTDEGPNEWIASEAIKELEQYPDVPLILEVVNGKNFRIIELERIQNGGKFVDMKVTSDKKF